MRIAFVGDSFVNGTGDPECLGWAGRLCVAALKAGQDITYYNLGVRRETSADIASRWRQEVSRRLPRGVDSRVVFSFGVNDTTEEDGRVRILPEESVKHLSEILSEARRSYPVLFIGPPPVADPEQTKRITRLSVLFGATCGSIEVPYLDTVTQLRASTTWMGEVMVGDGAHPSAGGYAEVARVVKEWSAWKSWVT